MASGCDVPDTRLRSGADLDRVPESLVAPEERVFAVRRFDREGEGEVHVEDLAQVREVAPGYKYDNSSYDAIGRVIRVLAGDDGMDEYVRRLVMIVAMGNGDAHLKNWSLIYRDSRTPALAPAYDLVCVTAYEQFSTVRLAFRLGGERAFAALTRTHFRKLATAAGADPDRVLAVVARTIDKLRETWPTIADDSVPSFLRTHIEERLTRLPLLGGN